MKELRAYVVGAAFMVFADRIIDVQYLTYPALVIVTVLAIIEGVKYAKTLSH
jgi:hypothetical protein